MSGWRSLLARGRYGFRVRIAHLPAIYLPMAARKRRMVGLDGDRDAATPVVMATQLVMEAFPRSGNTFAYAALRSVEPKLEIAHHLHAPAQLIAAARMGKPALVIVRQPRDAVLSFLLRHPELGTRQALDAWIAFHEKLRPWEDSLVVATFDQVTSDFGRVIARVNGRFGTSLAVFEHTPGNVAACFAAIEARNAKRFGAGAVQESGVARPSAERQRNKADTEARWERAVRAVRRARADGLFAHFECLSRR